VSNIIETHTHSQNSGFKYDENVQTSNINIVN